MTTAKRKMRKRIREAQRQAQAMKHGGKKIFRKNRNGGPIVVEDVKYNKTIETTAAVPEAPKMTASTFPLNYTMTVQTPNVESFSMTFDPNKAPLPPEPTQKVEKMPVPDFASGMPLPESTPVQKEQKKMASTQTRTKPKTPKTASARTKTGAKKTRPFATLGKAKGVSLLEVGRERHLPKTLGQRKETAVKIARRTRQNAQKQMSRLEMFAKAAKKERYMNGAIETYQRRNDIVAQLSRVLNGLEGGILNSADFIYRYNQNFGNLIKSLQPKINGKRQYIGITKAYANPEYLRMYNAFLGRPADMPVDKKEFNEAFRGKTVKQLMANYQGKEQELAGKEPNISTRKIRVTIPKRKIYIKRQQRANQKMAEREALPKLVENSRSNRLTLPKAPTRRDWLNLAGTALNRYPVLKKVALWAVIAGTLSLGLGAGRSSPVAETNTRQTEPSVTHVQTASPTMEQNATMTQAPEVAQASMQAETTEATTTPAPEVETPAVEMTETVATETPTVEPEMTEATPTPAPEVEAPAVETTETVATETPTVEPEMTEATPTPAPEVETPAVETTETVATETPTVEPEMTEATPTPAPEVETPAVEMTETVATETPTVEPEMTEATATEVEEINAEIKSFQDKWEEYRAQREADDWNKFQEINKDRVSYINGLEDSELLKKESEAFRKDWNDYRSANEKLDWMQFQEENKEQIETINRSYDEIGTNTSTAIGDISKEEQKPQEEGGILDAVVDGAKAVGGAIADGASWTWEGTKTVGGAIADGAVWTGGKIADGAVWTGEKIADGASATWEGTKTVGGAIADGAVWTGGKIADGAVWTGEKIADGASATWEGTKTVGGAIADGAVWTGGKIADGASATWEGTKTVGGAVADGAVWTGGKIADGAVWAYDGTKGVLTSVFDGSDETAADRIVAQAQEEFTSLQEQWETLKRETATNNITTGFWSRVFVTKTKVNAEIDRMNKSGETDELWKGFYKEHEADFDMIGRCFSENQATEDVSHAHMQDTEEQAAVKSSMSDVLSQSSAPGVLETKRDGVDKNHTSVDSVLVAQKKERSDR